MPPIARHAADKRQPFAVAGAVGGPRLSHVGSHGAKMTAQGEHGNSGNLRKDRRGCAPPQVVEPPILRKLQVKPVLGPAVR